MHLWDDTLGTIGPTYKSTREADDVAVATHIDRPTPKRASRPVTLARAVLCVQGAGPRVVIADGDAARRAAKREELSEALPDGTVFLEASTVSEALDRARGSRMLVVSGAVDDASAAHLAHLIGRRYPDLHVVDAQRSHRLVSPPEGSRPTRK